MTRITPPCTAAAALVAAGAHVDRARSVAACRTTRSPMARAGGRWLQLLTLVAAVTLSGCTSAPAERPTAPVGGASPQASRPADRADPRARAPRPDTSTPAGSWDVDLERDEERGGHTIARHVGRTDAQLQARLRRESISAASTYPDLETAERIVQRTLDENTRRVEVWISRRAPKPNLAIRHRARDGLPVGRILGRGETRSREAHGAVVVLRWRGQDWHVLTSYPESVR